MCDLSWEKAISSFFLFSLLAENQNLSFSIFFSDSQQSFFLWKLSISMLLFTEKIHLMVMSTTMEVLFYLFVTVNGLPIHFMSLQKKISACVICAHSQLSKFSVSLEQTIIAWRVPESKTYCFYLPHIKICLYNPRVYRYLWMYVSVMMASMN